MPIEVFCQSCQKKLRVPDTAAGKRIKCPKCQGVLSVPAASGSGSLSGAIPTPSKVASKSSASIAVPKPGTPAPKSGVARTPARPVEQWFVQTEDGQQYGPVSRQELDQWYADGRITTDTQVLREGSDQWQWASDLYPDLAPEQAAASGGGIPDFGAMGGGSAPAGGSASPFDFGAGPSTPSTTTSVSSRGKKGGKKRGGKAKGGKPEIDYLAIATYIMGGFLVLGALVFMLGGTWLASLIGEGSGVLITVFFVFGIIMLLISAPLFAAGYGLQERASWARILTLVIGALVGLGGLGSLNPIQIAYAYYAFKVLLDKENAAAFR